MPTVEVAKPRTGLRETYNCGQYSCSQMFQVEADGVSLSVECSIRDVEGVRSFPKQCRPVMFRRDGRTWVMAIMEWENRQINPEAPPRSDVISIRGRTVAIPPQQLLLAAERALTKAMAEWHRRIVQR